MDILLFIRFSSILQEMLTVIVASTGWIVIVCKTCIQKKNSEPCLNQSFKEWFQGNCLLTSVGFGSSPATTNSSVLSRHWARLFCTYIAVLPAKETTNWFAYRTDHWCWHTTSNMHAFFFSPEIPTWQHKILFSHPGKRIWRPFPLHFTALHWKWRHISHT